MSNDLIYLANRLSQSLYDSSMLSPSELKLLKLVNIAVPKVTDRNTFLKSKKFTDYLKDKALVIATHAFQIVYNLVQHNAAAADNPTYLSYIGFQSTQSVPNIQITYPVRYLVAFGNNSLLVKNVLRSRWWLT